MDDREVVDGCNALAREFYSMHGYQVPAGYAFHKASHPQERLMWDMAVAAYEHVNGTDVESALAGLEE